MQYGCNLKNDRMISVRFQGKPFNITIIQVYASLVAQRLKRLPARRETRVQSLGWEDPLEKEMATYSSILAWRISRTEEPGGLLSTGSQRVRHDWATSLSFTFNGQDIDLHYCGTEWFALETNRDHSVVYEIALYFFFYWTLLLTMMATPFLLRDSCLQ